MDEFLGELVAAEFADLGQPATFRPHAGEARACRVVWRTIEAEPVIDLGRTRVLSDAYELEVPAAGLSRPAAGDVFEIDRRLWRVLPGTRAASGHLTWRVPVEPLSDEPGA